MKFFYLFFIHEFKIQYPVSSIHVMTQDEKERKQTKATTIRMLSAKMDVI